MTNARICVAAAVTALLAYLCFTVAVLIDNAFDLRAVWGMAGLGLALTAFALVMWAIVND